jgi:glucose/arabinose dehydrogenase
VFRNPSRARRAARPAAPRPGYRPAVETLEDRLTPATLPSGFTETIVASGLTAPTAMDFAPDGRLFIAEQGGTLRVVKNGALLPTPFLTLTVDSSVERGLLGVAFDPNFNANHFVYVYYTVPGSGGGVAHNRVSRFTASGDVAQANSEDVLLNLNDLGPGNHNGGASHFGTDGMLYVAVGENGNPANAQTLGNLLGKVLRLNVAAVTAADGADSAKLIPADNPFVGQASGINQVIDALGFRNPFTFAVQPGTGTVFVNDVGESTWEEIDRLTAGGNYGWNKSEGFATTVPPAGLGPGTYQDPQLAYNHHGGPAGGGIAITGGTFYDPPAGAADPFPSSFRDKYLYADLGGGWIRVFDPAHPGSLANPDTSSGFATGINGPVDLKVGPDGSLYYLAHNSGQAVRVQFVSNPGLIDDPAVFDPRTAIWYLRTSNSAGAPDAGQFAYGGPGWLPVAGDWNGDGKETIGVFNPATATWYLKNSNTPGAPDFTPFAYGAPGDIPVVGDWDGNGTATVGIFDPATATWYLKNSNTPGAPDFTPFPYGGPGWIPLVGDWDGDGKDGIGVFDPRTATFYLRNSIGAGAPDVAPFAYGVSGWVPVAGDWNGDGKDSIGIFDPNTATWYLKNATTAGAPDVPAYPYGGPNWRPVPGRWNPSAALQTAGGALASGVDVPPLPQPQLDAFVSAALGGAAPPPTVHFEVANLGGAYLGLALPAQGTVLIDDDAAGFGWFVDPTPQQNEEFSGGAGGAVLTATPGGPADGRMDLLTVVRHELGHLAGQADLDGSGQSRLLMVGTLAPGIRRA